MKNKFFILSLVFLFSILQSAFLFQLFGAQYVPNLVLVLAFALMATDREDLALFCALFGGLFIDLSGFGIIGISAFWNVVLLVILFLVRKYVFKNFYIQLIFIYFLSLLGSFLTKEGFSQDITASLTGGLINLLVFLALYIVTAYLIGREGKSKYKI